uniref:Major facilitator superfamily (MFS) profile domain-containing protein n=1 Tax=Laticauda laticaudata TaxID=8630 RepID=A0A8C5SS89_LATLA
MARFGDVLKMIGEFGAFQKCLVLLLCIPSFLTPFHMFGQVFISINDVPHYCNTSWIQAISPNLTFQQKLNLTIPKRMDDSLDQCSRFTPVDLDIETIMKYGLNSTQDCEQGWVYPTMKVPTLVTEFDLVCDRRDLSDISQSIFMGGLLAGSLIFSFLSDRGLSVFQFSLGSEWVGPSYRPQALIIIHCANAMGQMALAGIAYFIRDWRLFQIIASAPAFVIFFYAWVLPNSARWLITKKKIKEAKDILLRAATINNRIISKNIIDQLTPEKKVPSKCILDFFKKSYLKNMTLIMALIWFVDSLVYYEVSLHVGDFGLNIYLTQFIFGAVEIPSRILSVFLLQWIGRKKCQSTWLVLGGIVCVMISVLPKEFILIVTVLAVIGKSAMAAAFSTTYLFSAEIFPTVVRQFGLGFCSMFARVAGILAPLLGMLARYHLAIPMFTCGSLALIAGILCFLLPETCNKDLQDLIAEPERASTKTCVNQLSGEAMCRTNKFIEFCILQTWFYQLGLLYNLFFC